MYTPSIPSPNHLSLETFPNQSKALCQQLMIPFPSPHLNLGMRNFFCKFFDICPPLWRRKHFSIYFAKILKKINFKLERLATMFRFLPKHENFRLLFSKVDAKNY